MAVIPPSQELQKLGAPYKKVPKSTDSHSRPTPQSAAISGRNAMPANDKPADPLTKGLLAMLAQARRNTCGDPRYHSGRKKKEYASPYLEFLDKVTNTARRMPNIYEFDIQHSDGIRFADLAAGERVLNEIIFECQRSLEGIADAKADLEQRKWASGWTMR
jgi:hypothetical protein